MTTETFTIGDAKSVAKLTTNKPNQQNAIEGYAEFIRRLLEKSGGLLAGDELERQFLKHYGRTFGTADRKVVRGVARWKNDLAWAKVILQKRGEIRLRKVKAKELIASQELISDCLWILNKKRNSNSFRKVCKKCNTSVSLNAHRCPDCGTIFPTVKKQRVMRMPAD